MKRDLNVLVAEYVEKAKIHAEADDNEIGNAAAKRLIELRELLKHGRNPRYLLPDSVINYIQRLQLYCGT